MSKANTEQEFRPETLNRIFTIFTIFLWQLLVTSQSPFHFTLFCFLRCLFFLIFQIFCLSPAGKGVRKMPKERTPVSQWKFFYTFVFLFPWLLLLTRRIWLFLFLLLGFHAPHNIKIQILIDHSGWSELEGMSSW